jgi:phosphomannomutase
MDGTLTPSRKMILQDMIPHISGLLKHARVGIVSGSGFEYIKEQCSPLWEDASIDPSLIDILPCNGTQKLIWNSGDQEYQHVYNRDMREHLGELSFKKLVRAILELQSKLANTELELTVTGTFIQYRGSMLNWCMAGRDHNDNDRADFLELDKQRLIRKNLLTKLRRCLQRAGVKGITMALGGECSIDIYPDGWDKTHALLHYPELTATFVGDKCKEGGNDYTIFEKLGPNAMSFETDGPDMTKDIINKLIRMIEEI